MVVDVSHFDFDLHWLTNPSWLTCSSGLSTKAKLTYLRCMIHMGDTVTGMELYVRATPKLSSITDLLNALQNWRAAVAMLFSITPTLPGLINNINPKIFVGNASLLFNIAWLYGVRMDTLRFLWFLADPVLQFFSASAVYLVLSKVFPAYETFLEEAILGDDFGLNTPTEESPAPSGEDEKEKPNVLAKHVDWRGTLRIEHQTHNECKNRWLFWNAKAELEQLSLVIISHAKE